MIDAVEIIDQNRLNLRDVIILYDIIQINPDKEDSNEECSVKALYHFKYL